MSASDVLDEPPSDKALAAHLTSAGVPVTAEMLTGARAQPTPYRPGRSEGADDAD